MDNQERRERAAFLDYARHAAMCSRCETPDPDEPETVLPQCPEGLRLLERHVATFDNSEGD